MNECHVVGDGMEEIAGAEDSGRVERGEKLPVPPQGSGCALLCEGGGQGPGLGVGELGDSGDGVGAGAEEDLGDVGLDVLAEGVEILGAELREAAAEVTGFGWGCGWGVAAGGVEEDDGGVVHDGWEVDLLEHAAGGPDERLVESVFLEAGVHAEHGDDGCGGGKGLRAGKKNPGDAGVLRVLVQVTLGALRLGQDQEIHVVGSLRGGMHQSQMCS